MLFPMHLQHQVNTSVSDEYAPKVPIIFNGESLRRRRRLHHHISRSELSISSTLATCIWNGQMDKDQPKSCHNSIDTEDNTWSYFRLQGKKGRCSQ